MRAMGYLFRLKNDGVSYVIARSPNLAQYNHPRERFDASAWEPIGTVELTVEALQSYFERPDVVLKLVEDEYYYMSSNEDLRYVRER
jgi:hypothetical protein